MSSGQFAKNELDLKLKQILALHLRQQLELELVRMISSGSGRLGPRLAQDRNLEGTIFMALWIKHEPELVLTCFSLSINPNFRSTQFDREPTII